MTGTQDGTNTGRQGHRHRNARTHQPRMAGTRKPTNTRSQVHRTLSGRTQNEFDMGTLERKNAGRVDPRNTGTQKHSNTTRGGEGGHWNLCTWEHRSTGTQEHRNTGTQHHFQRPQTHTQQHAGQAVECDNNQAISDPMCYCPTACAFHQTNVKKLWAERFELSTF